MECIDFARELNGTFRGIANGIAGAVQSLSHLLASSGNPGKIPGGHVTAIKARALSNVYGKRKNSRGRR